MNRRRHSACIQVKSSQNKEGFLNVSSVSPLEIMDPLRHLRPLSSITAGELARQLRQRLPEAELAPNLPQTPPHGRCLLSAASGAVLLELFDRRHS